jgi:hypothetical protein
MAKSTRERFFPKDDGQCSPELSKRNWKYIRLKDIQIDQIGASANILGRKESATKDTNKANLRLRSSVHYAKECHKEPTREYCQVLTISVRGIPRQETELRIHQNHHRFG